MRNEAKFSEALSNMVIAITTCSLYSREHQSVTEFSKKAFGLLSQFFVKDTLTITLLGDTFLLDDIPVIDRGAYVQAFMKKLRAKGIDRVIIQRGVSFDELKAFVIALASKETIASSPHITVGLLEIKLKAEDDSTSIMSESMAKVAEVYDGISRFHKLDISGLEGAVLGFITALKKEVDVLRVLSPVKAHSAYTYVHESNVSVLAIFQAEALGFDGEALYDVGIAGLLHDIGKLFVPHELIDKQTHLNETEWLVMRQHPVYGALYLSNVPEVPRLAVTATYEHHMKYDGSGYPERKRLAKGQHIISQLVALADFFDALRSRRSYRDTTDIPQIVGLLKQSSGKDFNPGLVANFIRALKRIKAFGNRE